MSVFIGSKNKRVELAERKDAINPNLLTGSKDFTGDWINFDQVTQKDKYLDFTAIYDNWQWNGISQYIDVNKGETFTTSAYVKANAGSSFYWYATLNSDNEDGHTRTDTSPNGQAITATGDWQKTSFTFTVTSDGTIRPRIESGDSTVSFWVAGMKLEHGSVATDWCPALEDYAWTSDITNLQNTVNSKVNVDGPLYKDLKQFNNWSDLFDDYAHSEMTAAIGRLVTFRDDTNGANTVGDFGSGIAFGGGDTSGALSVDPFDPHARIVGGNDTSPAWHEDIAWKSDITNLQNVVNGKANSTDVSNLQSMITGLSTKVDSATTKLQGQITEIQSKNYIEGYNCANESDAETYSKAHPNTLVTVS